jgi:hypothetical protein
MRGAAVLLAALFVAGCGSTKKPDHATLTDVKVGDRSVEFTFDSRPQTVRHAYAPRRSLAECGSGAPVRPTGSSFLVVHFLPAQSRVGVPKRIVMPSGIVRDVAKVCDFEADVGWAIGISRRLPVHVSTGGRTVTVTFG